MIILLFWMHFIIGNALPATSGSEAGKLPDIPVGYFSSPIGKAGKLSATFGELRYNHFHAGLDIRSSKGRIGDAIYAAADGYISRISIKSGGYGQAVFIAHPNGFTSVYAHLDDFSPELAEFVEKNQYAQESFELELYPSPTQFPVFQGQEIAKMGNTGHSYGPHLHFEIRETKTDQPLNPMLFGVPIEKDEVAPFFTEMKLYQFRNNKTVKSAYYKPLVDGSENYRIQGDTILVTERSIGLAIKAFDKTSPTANKDGLYAMDVFVGSQSTHVFGFEMNSFEFSETQCINAHCDYEEIINKDGYYNRCFRLPNNPLPIYTHLNHSGWINVPVDSCVKVAVSAKDFAGNSSLLTFVVKGIQDSVREEPKIVSGSYALSFNKDNVIEKDNVRIHFADCTFYEDLHLVYYQMRDSSYRVFSDMHRIHDYKTPLHKPFEISIKPARPLLDKADKAFVANCSRSRTTNCGGIWKGDFLYTKVKALGDYCIMVDDTPPSIRSVNFKKNLKKAKTIKFRISDNFSVDAGDRKMTYKAYIDNQWILMKLDGKTAILTYDMDRTVFAPGTHEFRLVVKDIMNNEATFQSTFIN